MAVEFKQSVLPSGLRICAEVDPAAHTASVGFFVRTGARDEATSVMGVSHFLEHMMFKGSDKRSAAEVNEHFDAIGAQSNAYTSSEMTAFHASVLPEVLPHATEILSDIMRPALRTADFDTEKGVIIEEIAMYADEPMWVLYEQLIEEHFGSRSALSHRVLGTPQTITDLTALQMREYFDRRYSADNTTVAMAGKLDFEAMVAHINRLCGHWERTQAQRTHDLPSARNVNFELRDSKVSRGYRMSMSRGPGMTSDERYAAFCAAQLLGGGENSLLHWALVEPGIAESAEAGYDPHDGFGTARIFVATEPENLERAWSIACRQAEKIMSLVRARDLEQIKTRAATGVVIAGEKPGGRMHRLGRLFMYSDVYTTLEEELAKINAVTLDAVARSLAKYPLLPATIGTLLPAVAGAEAAAMPSYQTAK